MSVTLTYDNTLARVRITGSGYTGATAALIERSTDNVQWTTVRGASAVTVTAGVVALTDDYEFSPGIANYYRITAYVPIAFVAAGTAASANNASVNPGLPAGQAAGDLLLCYATSRGGNPNTPAGYTLLLSNGNQRLFGKISVGGGEVAPTVSFTGTIAGDDCLARVAAFRNAALSLVSGSSQVNAGAQNIDRPFLTVPQDRCMVMYLLWKADDWTSVTAPGGWTSIGDVVSTAGTDAAQAWAFFVQTTATNLTIPSTATVTGGAVNVSRSAALAFAQSPVQQTNTITPAMVNIWLKNVCRPFLNRALTVVDYGDIEQPTRTALFDVLGRSYPVAVSDQRGSRRMAITVMHSDPEDYEDFRLCLATGDTLFLHVPPSCDIPTMYASVGDLSTHRTSHRGRKRFTTLPLTEVAKPAASVIGVTITIATVVATYATTTAVLAVEPTIADLLDGIGSPTDVLAP